MYEKTGKDEEIVNKFVERIGKGVKGDLEKIIGT
jgi:hypothetical protein